MGKKTIWNLSFFLQASPNIYIYIYWEILSNIYIYIYIVLVHIYIYIILITHLSLIFLHVSALLICQYISMQVHGPLYCIKALTQCRIIFCLSKTYKWKMSNFLPLRTMNETNSLLTKLNLSKPFSIFLNTKKEFHWIFTIFLSLNRKFLDSHTTKEGKIRVMASIAPSSQTVDHYLETPWAANLAKIISQLSFGECTLMEICKSIFYEMHC